MDAATIRSEIAEVLLKGDLMTKKSACVVPELRAFTIQEKKAMVARVE
jgi:hypothetical protein